MGEGANVRGTNRQHHERQRRILAISLMVAVAFHIALFVLMPKFETQPMGASNPQDGRKVPPIGTPTLMNVLFGPPTISAADGSEWAEPDDHVLEAQQLANLPPDCSAFSEAGHAPVHGSARLVVNADGYVNVVGVMESTGDACGDDVLEGIADALHYHWLPNDRFPAPVELVQPITLAQVVR